MRKAALALLLVFLLLPAAAFAETRLMVVSDLHYMAPSLYRGSGLFLQVLRNGDGKAPQYGEELLAALFREIAAQKPDALLVTGDLTFNGERESHEALAAWFGAVEDMGVPVWVIPGNHDINTLSPVGFTEAGYYRTEPVTPEEFASIYAPYLEKGGEGFSYAVRAGGLTVCMTDVAWYRDQAWTFGMFTAAHASWLEEALKEAGGGPVITATHHSLLPHTEFARDDYLMFGHETMREIAGRYGVRLNLSGHLHIQHIVRERDLTDAALGAFCVWPHRYATVTLRDGGALLYEARSLNAAYLPEGFLETTKAWFEDITRAKVRASGLSGTPDEIEAMAAYAARFNLAYFSGTYRAADEAWRTDPAFALWEKQDASAFWQYMCLVMNEPGGDQSALEAAL